MKDGENPRETSVRGVGVSLVMRTKYTLRVKVRIVISWTTFLSGAYFFPLQ